ncbi:hypothetical protein [Kitasatospora sp. NPDC056731]
MVNRQRRWPVWSLQADQGRLPSDYGVVIFQAVYRLEHVLPDWF